MQLEADNILEIRKAVKLIHQSNSGTGNPSSIFTFNPNRPSASMLFWSLRALVCCSDTNTKSYFSSFIPSTAPGYLAAVSLSTVPRSTMSDCFTPKTASAADSVRYHGTLICSKGRYSLVS